MDRSSHRLWMLAIVALTGALARPAAAADGCTVMLCLAGNWRHISACVPPVRAALRDLALGRSLPTCAMVSAPGGSGADVGNRMLDLANCPPQYLAFQRDGDGNLTQTLCTMSGAVSVTVDGAVWSRTYWNASEGSVTWYSDAARARLDSVDDQYDRDLSAWRASPAYSEWDCVVNGNCPNQSGGQGGGGDS